MKGYNYYSYHPYKPVLADIGDIYISRLAPGAGYIHLEWTAEENTEYSIYCRPMAAEGETPVEFALCGTTKGREFDITGLADATDFEFYVTDGQKKSLVRLARTGYVKGVVINYLHPLDPAYRYTGQFLGSPSIIRMPQGYLLASMDVFKAWLPFNLTQIYRSDDDGKSWYHFTDLMPCICAKLFLHKGDLYVLSKSTNSGDLLISKSTDGGYTFCAPVCLLRGSNGKNGTEGVHKNPQNVMFYNGRIYNTLEWGNWNNKVFGHAAMVMSCDQNDDLLVPENWSFTEPLPFGHFAPELEILPLNTMTIEGTLVVNPEGRLFNVMRFGHYHKAIAYEVNLEDPEAQLTYSHLIEFPANQSKFTILFDEVSGYYYSIGCYHDLDSSLYDSETKTIYRYSYQDMDKHDVRNCQSLLRSKDMENWEVVMHLQDRRDLPPLKCGLQYTDFFFEGDDILFQTRTGINEPDSFHNANYSVFHRLKNFRTNPVLD